MSKNRCAWPRVRSGALRAATLGASIALAACGGATSPTEHVVPVMTVGVTPAAPDLVLGDTATLTATPRAASGAPLAGRSITWSTSNEAVARVSAAGLVEARGMGTVTISATSEGKVGTATVYVVAPKIAGRTFVLTTVDGKGLPFLAYDRTAPDGSRSAHWIVADTLRLLGDGRLSYAKVDRWLDQNSGEPETMDDVTTSAGGFFEQVDDRVAVAWHYLQRPAQAYFTDTLQVRANDVVRRMALYTCAECPRPVVDFVYTRVQEK